MSGRKKKKRKKERRREKKSNAKRGGRALPSLCERQTVATVRHTRVTAYDTTRTHGTGTPWWYGNDEKVCRDLEQGPVIQAEALDTVALSLDSEVKQR